MTEDFAEKYKKWHTFWSFAKSTTRGAGCILTIVIASNNLTTAVIVLAAFLWVAEAMGVLEEYF